ncbi:MAG: Fe-S-containing hydro-lyase [Spirochaetota bacterium]
MKKKTLTTPLTDAVIRSLNAGDEVLISGIIYTARDAAHKKLCALIAEGKELPFDLKGAVIYFAGPAPAKPGMPIGSVGPTTSYRMDAYSPVLLKTAGLKGMIGKGQRSADVKKAMIENCAVYFAATGGAGALLSGKVVSCETAAYPELGPEAVFRLTVKDFPAVVATDCTGSDLYETAPKAYRAQ